MKYVETTKPYTLPETCTDAALVRCYWHLISHDPRWLTGLRQLDGRPYRLRKDLFTHTKTEGKAA